MMKKEMLQLDSWEITLEIARLRRRIAVLQRWRLLAWERENSEILPRPDMTTSGVNP